MTFCSGCLTLSLVAALLVTLAEGQRFRGGRRQSPRRGRQEAAQGYSSPADAPPPTYGDVPVYGEASDAGLDVYGGEDPALEALASNIPGVPGEDYPIYAEVPESGFTCDGQVDGGYYSDPEAECQVFHICTADGAGGLAKYSFLCPNGTVFNQNYFICDWWFNFDCGDAESLYSINDEIAAERAEIDAAASEQGASYGAPPPEYEPAAPAEYEPTAAVYEPTAPTYDAARDARRLSNRRNNRRQQRGGRSGRRGGRRGGGRRSRG